ncbi:MAG: hypothetical protein JNK58_10515 [Phycisphaerae bacterium]|nr:hypothetical protein [Phycisphaerae bacterium]
MTIIKNSERDRLTRNAIVLDLGDLRRTAEAMEADARSRARNIIDQATAERARILAGAHEQGFAEGRAAGHEQGITEGRAQGRADAIAAAQADAAQVLAAWNAALEQFETRRNELLLDAQSAVLTLAIAIAERIIKRTIQLNPAVVADQLAAALALTIAPSRLTVRTSPADLELVRAILPQLEQRFTSSPHVVLDSDPVLTRGSIVLITDNGEVDASIETQLDRIVESLLPAAPTTTPRAAGSNPAPETPSLDP